MYKFLLYNNTKIASCTLALRWWGLFRADLSCLCSFFLLILYICSQYYCNLYRWNLLCVTILFLPLYLFGAGKIQIHCQFLYLCPSLICFSLIIINIYSVVILKRHFLVSLLRRWLPGISWVGWSELLEFCGTFIL